MGYWNQVLADDMAVPTDRPLGDLTAELTQMLGDVDPARRDGTAYPMLATWVATSMLGRVLGAGLRPVPGHPIFFAALAVFICMLVSLWRGRRDVLPWAVAGAVALVTARLLPHTSWYIVAGAIAGSLAGALRDRIGE